MSNSVKRKWYKIKHYIKNVYVVRKVRWLYRYVVKVSQYAWFLKDDYDWDYSYIYNLLQYKIKRTRTYIEKYGLHLDASEQINDMKRAEELLEKLCNDDFSKDLYKEHESKWGKMKSEFTPINNSEAFSWHISYENVKSKEDKELEYKEYRDISIAHEERKQKAKDELFDLLKNKIEYWWD